jgi:hypothetical protein
MAPSFMDELRGRQEVESFLAERHVFWRLVPRTFIPVSSGQDGNEFKSKVWHWVKTGHIEGGDTMKEMKQAVGFFRRMFKSKSVTGRHVVAITEEHREKFPILHNYKEVVIERRGGKRQVQIV